MTRVPFVLLLLTLLTLAAAPRVAASEEPRLTGQPRATAGRPYTIELSGLPPGARGWYAHFDDGPDAGSWHEPGDLRVTHVFTEPARLRVIRCHWDDAAGEQIPIERLRIEVLTEDGESLKPPPPPPLPPAEPLPLEQQRVGLNLTSVNYYSEEEPFADRIKSFSPWKAERRKAGGGGWEEDPRGLELREDGMPARLLPGQRAFALRDFPRGGTHGTHTLSWEGQGRLTWGLRPSGESRRDGFNAMKVFLPERPDGHARVMLILQETNPADPVRNLRLTKDGADPDAVFDPGFLARWSFADGFRYMDWAETNNSTLERWEDRPEPGDWTWATGDGVPLEVQVAHANATGADPWFCVPHRADDGYVRRMAGLVRDTLDPGLVATIELSNEVWNWQFTQTRYADERGRADPEITEAHHLLWTVKRSLEVFAIFDEAFTGEPGGRSPRLRRALGAQSSNPWVATKVFESQAAADGADTLATAPYFGGSVKPERADWFRTADGDALDNHIAKQLEGTVRGIAKYPPILAGINARRDASLPPVVHTAYEGGGHFLPPPGAQDDPELMRQFERLGQRPAFEDAYFEYLKAWHALGGSDMMLFSSIGDPSHWGDWGLMRHAGQPLSETPKLRGVLDYLEERR